MPSQTPPPRLNPLLTLWAATGIVWTGLLALVVGSAILFSMVVTAVTAFTSRSHGVVAVLGVALFCIPMTWEWVWHSLAPRLGVDLVDVLHGWGIHVVLALGIVIFVLAPMALAVAADQLVRADALLREQLSDVSADVAAATAEARKGRGVAWAGFWGMLFIGTVVLVPVFGVLGWAAERFADDPAPPPATWLLDGPRAWLPAAVDNVPIPENDTKGRVVALDKRNGHAGTFYYVPLRKGERARILSADPGLRVVFQKRQPSRWYRVQWTWEDLDADVLAAYTGWYRARVEGTARQGRGGSIRWKLDLAR